MVNLRVFWVVHPRKTLLRYMYELSHVLEYVTALRLLLPGPVRHFESIVEKRSPLRKSLSTTFTRYLTANRRRCGQTVLQLWKISPTMRTHISHGASSIKGRKSKERCLQRVLLLYYCSVRCALSCCRTGPHTSRASITRCSGRGGARACQPL